MENYNIVKILCVTFYVLVFVQVTCSLNLGLISGDLKRTLNPLIIKKTSHRSPITINIKPGLSRPLNLNPILPPISRSLLKAKMKKPLLSTIRAPKLPKLPKIPKLPKLPLLPILPPIPKLPLLPLPLLPLLPPLLPPIIPGLSKLKPIRVPILGKTKLQKALASEIRPLKLSRININKKKKVKDKLLKLRRDGILTTPQLLRLKKILL